ncbi:MAG: PLDc N-terminal domain-containing protein [Bacillota bacterium]
MSFTEILLKFWPLLVLQLAMMTAGLLDIRKRKTVKHLPRAAWIVIIILGECLGPILYFAVGRGEE